MAEERTLQQRLRGQQKVSTYIGWGHEAADEIDRLTTHLRLAREVVKAAEEFKQAAATEIIFNGAGCTAGYLRAETSLKAKLSAYRSATGSMEDTGSPKP